MFRTGYRTTEFWVTVLATLGVFLAGLQGSIPVQYSIYLTTAIAVAYAASRGIAKWGTDLKKGYHTTEFFVAALTIALSVFETTQNSVPTKSVALCVTIITATLAAVRAFSKPNPLADQFHPALTGYEIPEDHPDPSLDEGDAE